MQRRNERFVERLPLVLRRPWQAYVLTTLFCLSALLMRLAAQAVLPIGYPFVSFFPAVILSSFLFGIRPGIYAGVLCGLMAWYVFIPPRLGWSFNPGVAVAMAFYTGVVTIDIALIHWMQRANLKLAIERERSRALAENRELLFRELQHRVSNNLQVVAALLGLQRRHVADAAARKALDDASGRLGLIGRISRALYDPSGEGQSIRAFLLMLTAELCEASGRTDVTIDIDAPDGLLLDPDVTVPLALIVAEAISNAIEHGFGDRRDGRVAILLQQGDCGALSLRIADNGRGLPAGFDPAAGSSLGLKIATTLAAQLGGQFRMESGARGGAVALLDVPARSL